MQIKAGDLREGDLVDLESIEATKDHPYAEYELAELIEVEREGDSVNLSINGVDPVVTLKADAVVVANRP